MDYKNIRDIELSRDNILKIINGKHPDFVDVYCIEEGIARIKLSFLSVLDKTIKSNIINKMVGSVENELNCDAWSEDDTILINLAGILTAEIDEYDCDPEFLIEHVDGPDLYFTFRDETNIMRKSLYNNFNPAKLSYFNIDSKIPANEDIIKIWGDTELTVNFVEDGEDFIKSDVADKMWHAVYHVLEDNNLLNLLVTDDENLQATEMVESNVFAGKAGLFSGRLDINKIDIYFEYSEIFESEESTD